MLAENNTFFDKNDNNIMIFSAFCAEDLFQN